MKGPFYFGFVSGGVATIITPFRNSSGQESVVVDVNKPTFLAVYQSIC